MMIEPYILIPSSALAVLFMVLFIRLVAGPRNACLTESNVRDFLSKEETGVELRHLLISEDNKFALTQLKDKDPLRLVRSFGDKIVMQSILPEDLESNTQQILISRKDISHPAITFQFPKDYSPPDWLLSSNDKNEIEVVG